MTASTNFEALALSPPILKAVLELGYESPTAIQEQSIPVFMAGKDLLAQAQTGTGKTAAFALPILSKLDLSVNSPQALIIAPTRELAIQVAEAFQSYAKHLKGFHVTPIYGGQEYGVQLKALKRGTHVVVGTPGRVMDHLRRKTLALDHLKTIVLDEADEMLKMGFIDDIEWILEQVPADHQTGLFSATLPASIQNIAKRYLTNPEKIQIKPSEKSVATIEQVFMRVNANQKLDALTRFLEVEKFEAAIIFTRTKTMSSELAEKLQARGYAVAALNGDMKQSQREKVIERIKKGSLDIVVATDVAARGIDVERIGHVINYDIPTDTESYIHRIGRTGRAGRKGKALLFVTPREQRLLKDIERAISQPIKQIEPPSVKQVSELRNQQLAEKVTNIISKSKNLKPYQEMIASIVEQIECNPNDIAAALAYLLEQSNPMPIYELDAVKEEPAKRGRSSSRSYDRSDKPRGKKPGFAKKSYGGDRKSSDKKYGKSSDSNDKKYGKPSESKDKKYGKPSESKDKKYGKPSASKKYGKPTDSKKSDSASADKKPKTKKKYVKST